jgi:tRNA nucleotidyltransferase/poly(A) polymerase
MAIGDAPPIDPGSTPKALRAALYTLGRQTVIDRLMITQATSPGTTADYQSARQFATQWAIPELPISGVDITALGVAEGAMIGQLLRAVETWWRDHDFQPDHAACHRHLEGLLAANKVR